jgi:hypothetical protein
MKPYGVESRSNSMIFPNNLLETKEFRYNPDENSFEYKTKKVCMHAFCKDCILNWSIIAKTCPICRRKYDRFVNTLEFEKASVKTETKAMVVFKKNIREFDSEAIQKKICELIDSDFMTAAEVILNNPELNFSKETIATIKQLIKTLIESANKSADYAEKYKLLETARKITIAVLNEAEKSMPLEDIVYAYIGAGCLEAAEDLVIEIPSITVKFRALMEIGKAYIILSKYTDGKRLLAIAEELTFTCKDEKIKPISLVEIAEAYISINQHNDAERLLSHAEVSAGRMPDSDAFYKSKALKKIVLAYISLDKLSKAQVLAMLIPNEDDRNEAVTEICQSYFKKTLQAQSLLQTSCSKKK